MAFFKASSSISAESRVRIHSLCAKTVHNTASCITWCTKTVIVRICRCRKFCLSSLKLLLLKDMLLLLKHKREEMLGKTRATEERAVDVQAARPRAHNKARGLTRKRRSAQQTLRGASRHLGVH